MLSIKSLCFTIGDLPVVVTDTEMRRGTINVIIGKNNSGKSRFCEALTSCHRSNQVYLDHMPLQAQHFAYLDASIPTFFDVTGRQLLTNYGTATLHPLVAELAGRFNVLLKHPVSTYSTSNKKIMQFLWIINFNTPVYIFDSLLDYLDHDNASIVKDGLRLLRDDSRIILLTARSAAEVSDIADQTFMLNNRSLEIRHHPHDVLHRTA
jgi:ABC-type multidrug transport system ATPase subunit